MTHPALLTLLIAAATCALPQISLAQDIDQVATPPPNLVLANYDSVPVGPFGGLEGSAFAARVGDPSATWFNPAGLSRQTTAQISGSAGVYERTAITPRSLSNSGGSVQQLPSVAGFTFNVRGGLTAGAVLVTTNAWTQEIDAELVTPVANGQERIAYSADSEFGRRVAAVGVGYHRGGAWRIGGGAAFSMMDLRLVASVSDRIADTTGLRTALVAGRASGSALQLRTQGGVQYDAPQFRFGGAIRTPGLTIRRSGTVTLDGTLDTGAGSLGASLFDADARFEYRLPWELHGGAAYVRDRVEIELNLQGYTSISAYTQLATDQPMLIYSDTGTGPPTVLSRPFDGLTSASNGVVNVSLGGHVKLLRDKDLRVHAGFATNQSPVAEEDEVFNNVDLASWTLGISGTLARFQFAAGLNRRSGTAKDVLVRNLLNGEPLQTNIDVRSVGFIYSIGYQF
jgi:hypothetical protein